MAIEKAAVVGAGLMGGAIAAHIANAGHEVVLLDIVPEDDGNRNALAEGAVARMLKDDPAPFMDRADARRVTTGNIEDHLRLLGDADWIVEAVTERVDVKQEVYRRIDAARKTGSIVSSNTSTILWRALTGGMPESFARDFLITHFFNPPRYMRLLEVVAGPTTRQDAAEAVEGHGTSIDIRTGLLPEPPDLGNAWQGNPLPDGPVVYFEVEDDGCGMDDDTRSRIFDGAAKGSRCTWSTKSVAPSRSHSPWIRA